MCGAALIRTLYRGHANAAVGGVCGGMWSCTYVYVGMYGVALDELLDSREHCCLFAPAIYGMGEGGHISMCCLGDGLG